MDKKPFFQAVMNFIGNVHSSTHFLTKDARSNKLTPQKPVSMTGKDLLQNYLNFCFQNTQLGSFVKIPI